MDYQNGNKIIKLYQVMCLKLEVDIRNIKRKVFS